MAGTSPEAGSGPEYEPDFTLPKIDAITEENWPEYEARGFEPRSAHALDPEKGKWSALELARDFYGIEHVYTGDAFDEQAGRPLRHKPGKSVYVSPEGMEGYRQRSADAEARRQAEPDTGPDAS